MFLLSIFVVLTHSDFIVDLIKVGVNLLLINLLLILFSSLSFHLSALDEYEKRLSLTVHIQRSSDLTEQLTLQLVNMMKL